MHHLRKREMGWSKRQHIQISAESFSPSQCPESCVLARRYDPDLHCSSRMSREPACIRTGACGTLQQAAHELLSTSQKTRMGNRAGLVASTVKRQSPEESQLVPLPQSAIYSLARDLRTAAASCGRDSTITLSYPVWSSATRPAPQKTMTFDPVHPCGSRRYFVFFHPSHPSSQLIPSPNMQQLLQMRRAPPNLRRYRRRTTRFEQYCVVLFYVRRSSFFLSQLERATRVVRPLRDAAGMHAVSK
jgi:hypothetical protein